MSQPSASARVGAAGPAPGAEPQREGTPWKSMLIQMGVVFLISQIATQYFSPKPKAPVDAGVVQGPGTGNLSARLAWPIGTELDMHVYLSTAPVDHFLYPELDEGLPSWSWKGIQFGDWKESRSIDVDVPIPQSVMNNGSLWADIYLTTSPDAALSPLEAHYDQHTVYHYRKILTRYWPKRRVRKVHNLLAGDEPEENEEEEDDDPKSTIIVPYWHPNLTLTLISDSTEVATKNVPVALAPYIEVAPWTRGDPDIRPEYYPIIYPNDFWLLREHMTEVNSTTPVLPLHVSFYPLAWWKFNLYASMHFGFDQQARQGGSEVEEIKRMLIETNPILLGTTFIVTMLHMLFEFLAFKNDISHWRKKEEMTGVSLRTILTNVIVQVIILLYLIDNSVETSWMILGTQGIGAVIEAWKITKAVDITVVQTPPGSTFPYWIKITDKHVLSEDERKTQEYDALAFRWVSYAAIPLLIGYSIYSLMYQTHRGWYSYIITTLTSFVYMFGFAQLVPQLIINYKLKSVAHMPIKAMIYKTLSTVVDDFFAFCIKMPWLHRLACFRDDLVFLVFLYQRWIYRIDYKRANEYGQLAVEGIQDDKTELTKDVKLVEDEKGESKKTR